MIQSYLFVVNDCTICLTSTFCLCYGKSKPPQGLESVFMLLSCRAAKCDIDDSLSVPKQSSFVGAIAIGDLIKSTLGPKGMVS